MANHFTNSSMTATAPLPRNAPGAPPERARAFVRVLDEHQVVSLGVTVAGRERQIECVVVAVSAGRVVLLPLPGAPVDVLPNSLADVLLTFGRPGALVALRGSLIAKQRWSDVRFRVIDGVQLSERRSPRVDAMVAIALDDGTVPVRAKAVNVSADGALCSGAAHVEVGASLAFDLRLPGCALTGRAVVRRCQDALIGIEFVDLASAERESLDEYVIATRLAAARRRHGIRAPRDATLVTGGTTGRVHEGRMAALSNPSRLEALRRSGLFDGERDEALDQWARMTSVALNAPIAAMALVGEHQQVLASRVGLDVTEMPLTHSLSQYVVADDGPLVVGDLAQDPLLRANGAVSDHGVAAYVGVPIRTADGHVVGAWCAADRRPRQWSETDLHMLRAFAGAATTEVQRRLITTEARETKALLDAFTRVTDLLAGGAPLDEVLDKLMSSLYARTRAGGLVLVAERENARIRVSAGSTLPLELCDDLQAGLDEDGAQGTSLEDRLTTWADASAVRAYPPHAARAARHKRRVAWSTVLRSATGEPLGALVMHAPHASPASLEHDEIFRSASGLAATAIRQAGADARLTHESTHDALTGLPNRAALIQRLDDALARRHRGERAVTLAFVDIDALRHVNSARGHEHGDEVLRDTARRLSRVAGPSDTVARIGADEYALIIEGSVDVAASERVVAAILEALRAPANDDGSLAGVTASVGVVRCDANDARRDVLRRVDIALTEAKRQGGDRHVAFDEALQRDLDLRATVGGALRRALDQPGDDASALDVVYEPIFDMRTGRLAAAEALIQWADPSLGALSPADVMAVAQHNGILEALGEVVLGRACEAVSAWNHARDVQPLQVSVNVSAAQLCAPRFASCVADALARARARPEWLILELHATEAIHTPDATRTLAVIERSGVNLVLDDVATSPASLAALNRLPITAVKIDSGLISDRADEAQLALSAAIAKLAATLSLRVYAQGVDSPEAHERAATIGCDLAQGAMLGAPSTRAAIASADHAPDAVPTQQRDDASREGARGLQAVAQRAVGRRIGASRSTPPQGASHSASR